MGTAHSSAVNAVAAAAASGGQASPQRQHGKKAAGRHLPAGQAVSINVDERDAPPPQLEVQPITMYNTEPTLELRRFVAASPNYICYGLKAGQLRVLHRATAARALLRGHTAPVTDLSFFPGSEALLASTAKDGQLIVWHISEAGDGSLTGQQALALQLPVPQSGGASVRLAWHPACQDVLFFTAGARVLAAHISELTASAQQVDVDVTALPAGLVCLPPGSSDAALTSIALSADGVLLAAASTDGSVRLWRLPQLEPSTGSSSELVGAVTAGAPVELADGHALGSLAWTAAPDAETGTAQLLVAGNSDNSRLALYGLSGSAELQLLQVLELQSSDAGGFFNHMLAMPHAGLVILANAKRKSVYALHITGGGDDGEAGFDYFTEFAVTMPLLSLAAVTPSDETQSIALFVVQPTAVQQYALAPALCRPSAAATPRAQQQTGPPPQPVLSPASSLHSAGRRSPSRSPRHEPTSTPAPAPTVAVSPVSASAGNGSAMAPFGSPHQQHSPSSSSATAPGSDVAASAAEGGAADASPVPAPSPHPRLLTPKQLMQQAAASRAGTVEDLPHSPASSVASLGNLSTAVAAPTSSAGTAIGAAPPSEKPDGEEADCGQSQGAAGGPVRLLKRARADSDADRTLPPVAPPQAHAAAPPEEPPQVSLPLPASSPASAPVSPVPGGAADAGSLNAVLEAQAASQRRLVAHLNANFRDVLKAMRGELAKETRRMEAAMDARLARALQASAALLKAERDAQAAAHQQEVQRLAATVTQGLAQQLPARLEEALRREFAGLSAGLGAAVAPAVRAAIAQAPLAAPSAAAPAAAVNEKELADRLQAGLAKPLGATLRSAVERQLLPPLERAVGEALRQVDATLATGFREHAQASAAPAAALAASLQATLEQAHGIVDTMRDELAEGQRSLVTLATDRGAGGVEAAIEPPADPTVELAALLRERRYEEAFTKALSLSDVSTVTWLCGQLDPAILSQEPAAVSQGVLLSLLQQLGSELASLPAAVLPWIREAALALDPQDPVLAGHMRAILDELFAALQSRAAGATGAETATLRLVIHVVNSLRMQCR